MRDVHHPSIPCAGSKYHSVDHAGVCCLCGVQLTGVVFEVKPPYPIGTRLRGTVLALERCSTGWVVAIAAYDGQGYVLLQGMKPTQGLNDDVTIELAEIESGRHPWYWRIVDVV